MQARVLTSLCELRAAAESWNALWRRSRATLPTAEAEPLAVWLESFAPQARLHVAVVEEQGRFIAALPLFERRQAGLRAACLPNNDWAACGDLAVDSSADQPAVLQLLVDAVCELPVSLLWLNGVCADRPDWQLFAATLEARRVLCARNTIWQVGIVDIPHDWQRYWKSRSRNLRRQIQRTSERLQAGGGGQLNLVQPRTGEVEDLLRRGFELETRSWKATEGTCVLHRPEIFEFYCRQSQALAERGHLNLAFLEHQEEPIAFEYGLRAKGIYFSPKVAYNAEFASLSPGQQLRAMLYESFQQNPSCLAVDFHGPLSEATAKWATRSYNLDRLAAALDFRGSAWLLTYRTVRPLYKSTRARLRRQSVDLTARPLNEQASAPAGDGRARTEPVGAA